MSNSKPMSSVSACIDGNKNDYYLNRNENGMGIYHLVMNIEKEGFCSKFSFGQNKIQKTKNKTIMLVGATGAGKSTLINGMINYVLDVKWEDSSRVEMIPKETGESEAHSQTSKVTAYQINHRKGYRIPFSLTIIDTPGFGDTHGIKRDQEITKRIKEFFSDPEGITSIDAVCFVVQSSLPRLTHTQKYIFDSVLSIFGHDIKDNILILFTFSDGKAPAALSAINAADIPCARKEDGSCLFYKFNNSVLFSGEKEEPFDKMFWDMGFMSMKIFFDKVTKMQSKSLQLTQEVLQERDQLETIVEGLLPKITMGVSKANEVTDTLAAMETHRKLAEANKDFEYEVDTPQINKVDLRGKGIHTTTCRTCNFTCHDDCIFADDHDKARCSAMSHGSCRVCPRNCHWTSHSNYPYRLEHIMIKEKKTYEGLKKKYQAALGECVSHDRLVQGLCDDYAAIQKEVLGFIEQLSKCQKRLGEIALRPNPMTATDYIDVMIKSEEQSYAPGRIARINQLREVRKGAEVLQKVNKGEQLLPEEEKLKRTWERIKENVRGVFREAGNWFNWKLP